MEILGTIRFIPKGFELGTTLSEPNRSIIYYLFLKKSWFSKVSIFIDSFSFSLSSQGGQVQQKLDRL